MAKEAYYFGHDKNARNDIKIISLRQRAGWEGYGLYWALIETMAESSEPFILLSDLPSVCYALNIAKLDELERIISILVELNLLKRDEKKLWSESFIRRRKERKRLSKIRSSVGRIGASRKWQNNGKPEDLPEQKDTINKVIKVNKERGRTSSFVKPSLEEVQEEFKIKLHPNPIHEAEKFHSYYESNGWKVGRNPMKSWKAAVAQWISRGSSFGNRNDRSVGQQTTTPAHKPAPLLDRAGVVSAASSPEMQALFAERGNVE